MTVLLFHCLSSECLKKQPDSEEVNFWSWKIPPSLFFCINNIFLVFMMFSVRKLFFFYIHMWVKLPMMGVLFVCFWLCGGASLPPNLTDNDYYSLLLKFMHFLLFIPFIYSASKVLSTFVSLCGLFFNRSS